MKYRELTPAEKEAYEVGYKVGNHQIVITDVEWETESEHKIYRKGYMAGLMDYKRNISNISNVSNVSNVHFYNSVRDRDRDRDRDGDGDGDRDRDGEHGKGIGGVGEKGTPDIVGPTLDEVLSYAKSKNEQAGCGGYKISQEDAEKFFTTYAKSGWKIHNQFETPIRDWKVALLGWARECEKKVANEKKSSITYSLC